MSERLKRERLTEDLLARLLESETPEAYLAQGETYDRELSDYLYELLRARGLNRSGCFVLPAFQGYGPRCVAMPSSSGASSAAARARNAMTSCTA